MAPLALRRGRRFRRSSAARTEQAVDVLRLSGLGRTLMTRKAAARIAGFTFLFYIVVGVASMGGAFRGPTAELATYAQNASAVILALTLFVVTRVEQPIVAALGMIFRLAEGMRAARVLG